jgi:hypothetical protein
LLFFFYRFGQCPDHCGEFFWGKPSPESKGYMGIISVSLVRGDAQRISVVLIQNSPNPPFGPQVQDCVNWWLGNLKRSQEPGLDGALGLALLGCAVLDRSIDPEQNGN